MDGNYKKIQQTHLKHQGPAVYLGKDVVVPSFRSMTTVFHTSAHVAVS